MDSNLPRTLANEVQATIESLCALLDAIDSNLHSLMDSRLWGTYWPIMESSGRNMQALLAISDRLLAESSEAQRKVVQSFYGKID